MLQTQLKIIFKSSSLRLSITVRKDTEEKAGTEVEHGIRMGKTKEEKGRKARRKEEGRREEVR